MSRAVLSCLLATAVYAGCTRPAPAEAPREQTPSAPASVAAADAGLKDAVAAVGGVYSWRADINAYDYSEKGRLEEIVAARPREAALADLIACLDDQAPSRSLLDGRPVPVGIVCYQALRQLAYYEPPSSSGDVGASWGGVLAPNATADDMRRAREAWKSAADRHALIFL